MIPQLREYQVPCVKQAIYFFNSTRIEKPRIIVAPTAAGKSIMIAATAHGLSERVLVIQPSAELLKQNFGKYILYDQDVSAYSASVNQKKLAKVTFATIGSIYKNPEIFKDYKCLIVDEAHLYNNQKEDGMMRQFLEANPQLKILGFTATPFRLKRYRESAKLVMLHQDNNIYTSSYQHVIQIQEIAAKYWAKIDYHYDVKPSRALEINSGGYEYTANSIEKHYWDVKQNIRDQVRRCAGEKTLVFVPSVKEAEEMSSADPGSGFIHAKSDKKLRGQMIDDFKAGRILTMYNFDILGVGFDDPSLLNIIDGVPTLSLARYYQKVGRLTRVHPAGLGVRKRYYDYAGNTRRFGFVEDIEIRKIGTSYHVFSKDRQLTSTDLTEMDSEGKDGKKLAVFKDTVFMFGKFKGSKISECPEWYLSYMMDNLTDKKLVENIKLFLQKKKNNSQHQIF